MTPTSMTHASHAALHNEIAAAQRRRPAFSIGEPTAPSVASAGISLDEKVRLLDLAADRIESFADRATVGPWFRDEALASKGGPITHANVVARSYDVATCPGGDTAPEDGRAEKAIADADHIAIWQPAVARSVAAWLRSEAVLLSNLEPLVELWNVAIEQVSGVKSLIRLGVGEHGQPDMQLDSSDGALALARAVLAVAL